MTLLWDCGFNLTLSNWKHIFLTGSGFLSFQRMFSDDPFTPNLQALSLELAEVYNTVNVLSCLRSMGTGEKHEMVHVRAIVYK